MDSVGDFTFDQTWIPEGTKEGFGVLSTDKKRA